MASYEQGLKLLLIIFLITIIYFILINTKKPKMKWLKVYWGDKKLQREPTKFNPQNEPVPLVYWNKQLESSDPEGAIAALE